MSAAKKGSGFKRLVSIGECMVELRQTGQGGIARSFAGDSFNTAYYARLFAPPDLRIAYVSAVGTDHLSSEMTQFMQRSGIDVSGMRRIEDLLPGLYMIHLQNGERTFSYWRSDSAARRLADDPEWLGDAVTGAGIIFMSGITLAVLPGRGRRNLIDVLRAARARGCTIAFDPNIRESLWENRATLCETISEAASVSNLLLPSFDDEQRHFGDADPHATVSRYRTLGADRVVVKNGGHGITLADGDSIRTIPAVPVNRLVDSTSAGDSFNGAFLSRLQAGDTIDAAARLAARAAAIVIQHHGALVEPAALSMLPGFNPPP